MNFTKDDVLMRVDAILDSAMVYASEAPYDSQNKLETVMLLIEKAVEEIAIYMDCGDEQ